MLGVIENKTRKFISMDKLEGIAKSVNARFFKLWANKYINYVNETNEEITCESIKAFFENNYKKF